MHLGLYLREFDCTAQRMPGEPTPQAEKGLADMLQRLVKGEVPKTPPVHGWRAWRLERDRRTGRWVLVSLTAPHHWFAPGERDSAPPCRAGTAPGPRHRLGFHLLKHRHAARRLATLTADLSRCPTVVGECEAFGRIVEHELGYRAQGVAIRSLTVCWWGSDQVELECAKRDLADRYQCDVDATETGRPADRRIASDLRMLLPGVNPNTMRWAGRVEAPDDDDLCAPVTA